MLRDIFALGVGGCGGKLVKTFEDHTYELIGKALQESEGYKDLKNWEKLLSEEEREELLGPLGKETESLDSEKFEKLKNELPECEEKLKERLKEPLVSFEKGIIEKIEKDVRGVKEAMEEVRDKEKGNVLPLLEGLKIDSSKRDNPDAFIYNEDLSVETGHIQKDKFGTALLNAEGFYHRPEGQLAPLSLLKVQEEVNKKIEGEIRAKREHADRGVFSFVGLGGGTGTGIIGPFVEEVSGGRRAYFAQGVLSGPEDEKYIKTQQKWFRRCFNIILALNDLLTKGKSLDGIILVDNAVIIEKIEPKLKKIEQKEGKKEEKKQQEEENAKKIDEEIIRAIFPVFGKTACNHVDWSNIKEVVKGKFFVPCYASGKDTGGLINEAITKGKLAKCDHKNADKVFVFMRSIEDEDNVKQKLGKIFATEEIAIVTESGSMDEVREGLKGKVIVLESEEIGASGKENEVLILLRNPDIKDALYERLEIAKNFVDVLDKLVELIERKRKSSFTGKFKEKSLNEEGVTEELKKEFGDNNYHLKNPEIEVIQKSSKWIIVDGEETFYRIQKEAEGLNVYSEKSEEIANDIIEDIINNHGDDQYNKINEILNRIPKKDIEGNETDKIKEILKKEAKNFLFLVADIAISVKNKEYNYEYMRKIIKKSKEEIDKALEKLNNADNDNWLIFKDPIFSPEKGVSLKTVKKVLKELKNDPEFKESVKTYVKDEISKKKAV